MTDRMAAADGVFDCALSRAAACRLEKESCRQVGPMCTPPKAFEVDCSISLEARWTLDLDGRTSTRPNDFERCSPLLKRLTGLSSILPNAGLTLAGKELERPLCASEDAPLLLEAPCSTAYRSGLECLRWGVPAREPPGVPGRDPPGVPGREPMGVPGREPLLGGRWTVGRELLGRLAMNMTGCTPEAAPPAASESSRALGFAGLASEEWSAAGTIAAGSGSPVWIVE